MVKWWLTSDPAWRGQRGNNVAFFSLKTSKHLKMKKITLIASMLFIFVGATMAQTTPATKPATTTTHLKKDSTPDKRFKENKTPPPQHLKKDGTADKRFKENKTPATLPATTPATSTPKKP
jgi:hypothetical protein